jgi:8-oxo-dGTP pyrophosphatase MutT (NUDIX family)
MYTGVAIFLSRDGQVSLSKRSDPAREFYTFWQCPGGGQEPNESTLTTAIRELQEETDIALPSSRFTYLGHDIRHFSNGSPYRAVNYHVELQRYEEPLNREPHKCTPWQWFSPCDLPSLRLIPGLLPYIHRIIAQQRALA